MTFTLEIAQQILKQYHFLLGQEWKGNRQSGQVRCLIITPSDTDRYNSFLKIYIALKDNLVSLQSVGFDPHKVRVVVCQKIQDGTLSYIDLDAYLAKNGMMGISLAPDFDPITL